MLKTNLSSQNAVKNLLKIQTDINMSQQQHSLLNDSNRDPSTALLHPASQKSQKSINPKQTHQNDQEKQDSLLSEDKNPLMKMQDQMPKPMLSARLA